MTDKLDKINKPEITDERKVRLNTSVNLPAKVLDMCKKRGWSLHWTARGAYLHLEASELIEAIRGKQGDPISEAADVLLVLMSITESNNIKWNDVIEKLMQTIDELLVKPQYEHEHVVAS